MTDGLTFEKDARDTDPNKSGHRRARFRQDWQNAVEGEVYGDAALSELSWDNLGYRLGRIFEPTSEEMIEAQYERCVRQQKGAEHS